MPEELPLDHSALQPVQVPKHPGGLSLERFYLLLRMTSRSHTGLTNAHSKSLKHHTAMQSLFVAWYNFARKHEALKGQTPAMASGLTDHVWTVKELLERAAEC